MLSSLRNLDGRIDELLICLSNGYLKPKGEKEVKEKIERLLETRFKVVFSMMDLNLPLSKEFDAEERILKYENLKRQRQSGTLPKRP